ncbi:MAG: MazG nucleotide pyrophosphohydrolase domain-containing protein, partial [Candidatus Binataceae bacterium]
MSQQQEPSAAEAFIRLLEVVRELRRRCPWDREQTLGSAAKYLIEEAHEAAGALDRGEPTAIADELGDVIVQVLMAATIAAEQGSMNPEDPLTSARRKLIRRHPHIYADVKADTVEQVIENWDRIKREERGRPAARSALDEAGRELP